MDGVPARDLDRGALPHGEAGPEEWVRVLVVDDQEVRHEGFRKQLIGAELWHVYNVAEAIEALDVAVPFDVAFLDHDLKGIKVVGLEETGQEVCRYIARMSPALRPMRIVIHSWNNHGAAAMAGILQDASIPCERIPFSDLR